MPDRRRCRHRRDHRKSLPLSLFPFFSPLLFLFLFFSHFLSIFFSSLSLSSPAPRARPLLPLCSRAPPGSTALPAPLRLAWPPPFSLSRFPLDRPAPTSPHGRAPRPCPACRPRAHDRARRATAAWPFLRAQRPAAQPRSPLPTTRLVDGRSSDPHAHAVAPAHSAGDHGTVPPTAVAASCHFASHWRH